jgi:hypothetical protein
LSQALNQPQALNQQPQIEVVNDPLPAAAPAPATQTITTSTSVQQPVQPTVVVTKQPTTVVQDSPLTESAADRLRKQRLEVEQQTESKIVEKLEQERIRAEQERATKVLGALDEKKEEKKDEAPVAAAVAPVPAPQAVEVAPAPVAAPVEQAKVEAAPVAAPAAPATETLKTDVSKTDKPEQKSSNTYAGVDAGFVYYPSAKNVRTAPGLGFTIGNIFDDHFIVEGAFLWSRSTIESPYSGSVDLWTGQVYPDEIQMDQYGVSGAFKYRIFDGKVSPVVGGLLAYTYRNYKTKQCPSLFCENLDGSSWAIDAGLTAGADFHLSDNFTLGADLSYMFNVTYDVNSNGRIEPSQVMYDDQEGSTIEKIGYTSFLIHAKYTF